MNKRGVPGPELMMWIVVSLVILAGLVFGVRAAIKKTSGIECTGGLLDDCNDEEYIPTPQGTDDDQGTDGLSIKVNEQAVSDDARLFEGKPNNITIEGFDDNHCQAVILLNDAVYRESRNPIIAEGSCSGPLIIEFDSLNGYQEAGAKIELDVVVYKPGLSGSYDEPSSWMNNKKLRVSIS